jgi:hypothetical protein
MPYLDQDHTFNESSKPILIRQGTWVPERNWELWEQRAILTRRAAWDLPVARAWRRVSGAEDLPGDGTI